MGPGRGDEAPTAHRSRVSKQRKEKLGLENELGNRGFDGFFFFFPFLIWILG